MAKGILVDDNKTLSALAKAGKIVWPCLINNSKKIKFKYCDTVKDENGRDLYEFEHESVTYKLEFHSGCFMPYVYAFTQN